MNFYFANGALLVPTFGQRDRDRQAIAVLQRRLPNREVIGVDCRKLIWGLGAIHCFTQPQQPLEVLYHHILHGTTLSPP